MFCAYATVPTPSGRGMQPVFDGIADLVAQNVDRFNTHELSELAWAFASLDMPRPRLLSALTHRCLARRDPFCCQCGSGGGGISI